MVLAVIGTYRAVRMLFRVSKTRPSKNDKSPPLALPLGELSAKLTERVNDNPHLALPLGELSPQATERASAVPFLSYFKKNSDIKIAFEKTECYNIIYITLHFDFEYR